MQCVVYGYKSERSFLAPRFVFYSHICLPRFLSVTLTWCLSILFSSFSAFISPRSSVFSLRILAFVLIGFFLIVFFGFSMVTCLRSLASSNSFATFSFIDTGTSSPGASFRLLCGAYFDWWIFGLVFPMVVVVM
ncbi:hypothetical protein F5H01DRAFT_343690 [Linnemannia elongata]|nr:hypothetical protein F5H01DRAFT_343690 [Linnemannia elongata]